MRLGFVYHTPFWAEEGKIVTEHIAIGKYVDALAPLFSEIILLVPAPSRVKVKQYIVKSSNIKIKNLPHYHNIPGYWKNLPKYFWFLFRSAKEWDILNIRIPTQIGFAAYLSAKLNLKPVFCVLVGEFYTYNSMSHFPYLKQKLVNLDSRIQDFFTSIIVNHSITFANGEELFNKYKKQKNQVFLTRSSTILSNEILDENIHSSFHKPIRILTVATVSSGKGTSLIPEIIHYLHDYELAVTWQYVGKIEGAAGEKEYAKTLAKLTDLGIKDYFKYCGTKNWIELKKLYMESDIFVLPTYIEGIPRVLLEAQSLGLPIVTTTVGGIPQAILNGENGVLVPPGNSYAIAQAIYNLISNKKIYEHLSKLGLETARMHSIEAETKLMIDQVFEIIKPMI